MSKPEDSLTTVPGLDAFPRLEAAVGAVGARIGELRAALQGAEAQGEELEELLKKFTGGEVHPSELLARLQHLERENRELLERLRKGKEGVERLLARIRFLEEQG